MAETYEEKMKAMQGMSDEERKKAMERVNTICKDYCGKCPSYVGTGETALSFCTTGKSKVIKDEKGCLCAACPITNDMSLRWDYYCTKGSGREQAGI